MDGSVFSCCCARLSLCCLLNKFLHSGRRKKNKQNNNVPVKGKWYYITAERALWDYLHVSHTLKHIFILEWNTLSFHCCHLPMGCRFHCILGIQQCYLSCEVKHQSSACHLFCYHHSVWTWSRLYCQILHHCYMEPMVWLKLSKQFSFADI